MTSAAQLAAIAATEHLDPAFNIQFNRLLFLSKNVTHARTQGAELEGDFRLASMVRVSGSYAYVDAVNQDTGLALTGRNPHQGSLRLDWTPQRFGLRANLRGAFYSSWIVSRSTTATGTVDTSAPKFALWDVSVSKTLRHGAELFGTVDNLADSQDPNTAQVSANGSALPILQAGDWPHVSWRGEMELDEMSTMRTLAAVAVLAGVMSWTIAEVGAQNADVGVLLLAHGGSASWNSTVTDLRARVNERVPTEVAFGMATRATLQAAVDRLIARGVRDIVGVPLFISSHSSVVDSTRYLLGARTEAPADLTLFARMNHGTPAGVAATNEHAAHLAMEDGTRPVSTSVPIRVVGALDDHPVVADILVSRARAISRDPAREAVLIVAHGPVSDDENAMWLADMGRLAGRMRAAVPFAQVEAITVRDDAPAPVRAAAAAELRTTVTKLSAGGTHVLVVPLLLSYGGIESGIRERLKGLDYTMALQGIMPDDRLIQWVIDAAATRR